MDPGTLDHLLALSRLRCTPEERERLAGQLQRILGYFQTLSELPTDQVEPTSHALPVEAQPRPDEPLLGPPPERMLAGAPGKAEGFYRVPRIVEG